MTNKTRGNLLVALQFVLLTGLVVIPAGRLWPFPEWLALASLVLILSGAMIALFSLVNLGTAATATPVPKEGAPLRTSGLYSVARHPIYTGLLVAGLGLTLRGDSVFHLGAFAGLVVLLSVKAHWEERMLVAAHPEYVDYARRVGRFMPGIGKLRG